MARLGLAILAVGLVAATVSSTWTLYLRRLGPVVYGMTVAEAERAAGVHLRQSEDERHGCTYVQSDAEGIAFMVQDGIVVRGDIYSSGEMKPSFRTASGIGIGSTTREVRQAYGRRITESPHPYGSDSSALYLTFTPHDAVDADYGMIFEIWQDTVLTFRSGFAENVALIEGCS